MLLIYLTFVWGLYFFYYFIYNNNYINNKYIHCIYLFIIFWYKQLDFIDGLKFDYKNWIRFSKLLNLCVLCKRLKFSGKENVSCNKRESSVHSWSKLKSRGWWKSCMKKYLGSRVWDWRKDYSVVGWIRHWK